MLATMDQHAEMLRKETDARFAEMMEESRKQNEQFTRECLNRIDNKLDEVDRKFAEHERHIEVVIDNKITSRLDAFAEYFPGAYKSYEQLERRVDTIETRQSVLESVVMDHIHGA